MLMANQLAVYGHTSLADALGSPISEAKAFFESPAFDGWQKNKAHEQKVQAAIVDRLNKIIKKR